MPVKNLQDAFTETLRETLSAEKQAAKALRQMSRKASHEQLRSAFEQHLDETERQIERLEQVFELCDRRPRAQRCEGISGIIDEGKELMHEDAESHVKDAMMIGAAQKMEHYEIATYGTLCTWAKMLGMDEANKLLGETLEEEKATDAKLTQMAGQMNQEALAAH